MLFLASERHIHAVCREPTHHSIPREAPMSDTILTFSDLTARIKAIFERAGLSELQADAVARTIAAGERDGCKSHGVYRIEGCLRTMKAGMVTLDAVPELGAEDGAIVRVAANGGFANA